MGFVFLHLSSYSISFIKEKGTVMSQTFLCAFFSVSVPLLIVAIFKKQEITLGAVSMGGRTPLL